MSAVQRFHEAANDALVKLSEYCLPGAKLALIIVTPGEPERDIILEDQGLDRNEVVSALRRRGLSIDGDNAYKRDLCDVISGAVILGAQDINPPPSEHWGKQFWDIGREHLTTVEELADALKLTTENLRACQATIHLAGGFDPAYVNDAQAAMAVARAALAKIGI